jgi:hypothetical protein
MVLVLPGGFGLEGLSHPKGIGFGQRLEGTFTTGRASASATAWKGFHYLRGFGFEGRQNRKGFGSDGDAEPEEFRLRWGTDLEALRL